VGEEEKHTYCCYAYRLYFLKCDMFKSGLRHIHDPVLSSLKMKGILSFFEALYNKPSKNDRRLHCYSHKTRK
jgi:hypothetical protein